MSTIGDNSRIDDAAAAELRQIVEGIERLEEEVKAINDDKSDKYGEARSRGYDVKALKRVVRARRKDRNQRQEEDSIFDVYMLALGEE